MNTSFASHVASLLLAGLVLHSPTARAVTNLFFNISQPTNLVESGTTWDTIGTEGYLFTVTRDKLFTGGVGLTNPIGRTVRVPWPAGLEAQAVTAGPSPGGAKIVVTRQDADLFAIRSFTAMLLANTAGAGAHIEIMPLLNGEDGAPDPFMYNATGYAGMQVTYNTPELAGFDEYKVTLYVDFALMRFTTVDASPPRPPISVTQLDTATIQLSWPTNAVGYLLETSPHVPAQTWNVVTNVPRIDADLFTVDLPAVGSQRFFRLRKSF